MKKAAEIHESITYHDITPGGVIAEGGTSEQFHTGAWRTMIPSWDAEKCKQCLLCFPVCPDSAIPICDGKREDFAFDYCKGCGICFKVCPFGAIDFTVDRK